MFEIETDRLILRKLSPGDENDIFEILSDEQTCLDGGGFHSYETQDEEYALLFQRFLTQCRYAVVLKSAGKTIGIISLKENRRAIPTYEIGFTMNPQYRRRGYMYEAVSSLIEAWFQKTDTRMFTTSHIPHNEASRQLIQKLGFTQEGMQHKALPHETLGPVDLVCYYKEKEQ